jgi:hypothetical protein
MGLFGDDSSDYGGGFKTAESLGDNGGTAKRVIDEEAGVVLYAVMPSMHDGYGLAAVPIEDTDLQPGEG